MKMGGMDCSGMRHCYILGFTLPYLANQPITVYTDWIKVGQVPPSALSLPASSARPLPGRCLCRSPCSTGRHTLARWYFICLSMI